MTGGTKVPRDGADRLHEVPNVLPCVRVMGGEREEKSLPLGGVGLDRGRSTLLPGSRAVLVLLYQPVFPTGLAVPFGDMLMTDVVALYE